MAAGISCRCSWSSCAAVSGDGDDKTVTKVLEQLVNLLAAKKEDGAASEEGKQPNPRGEM